MNLKKGVCFNGIHPETIMGIMVVGGVYERLGYSHTVTSICDGDHRPGSLHYAGLAFDNRTWLNDTGEQLPMREKERIAQEIRRALGPDWDVVVEATHIHCELDRKEA